MQHDKTSVEEAVLEVKVNSDHVTDERYDVGYVHEEYCARTLVDCIFTIIGDVVVGVYWRISVIGGVTRGVIRGVTKGVSSDDTIFGCAASVTMVTLSLVTNVGENTRYSSRLAISTTVQVSSRYSIIPELDEREDGTHNPYHTVPKVNTKAHYYQHIVHVCVISNTCWSKFPTNFQYLQHGPRSTTDPRLK